MGIIKLTMTDTIVFSALISAVDPVAVLAIFQEIGVNKDLYYLLFGESLLNGSIIIYKKNKQTCEKKIYEKYVNGVLNDFFQMRSRWFYIQQPSRLQK